MYLASIIRTLSASPVLAELQAKLHSPVQDSNTEPSHALYLGGIPRLAKGLLSTTLAQMMTSPPSSQTPQLLVVTASTEEATRWALQLEAMGWDMVYFYPTTSEILVKESVPSETVWGQMQVLTDLALEAAGKTMAIVTTEQAMQSHLPPPAVFAQDCLTLSLEMNLEPEALGARLTELGYERVSLVETEGQWSKRGDILDVFPVTSELPYRLEWFGDALTKMREFDPATQRSLDKIDTAIVTPTAFFREFTDQNASPLFPPSPHLGEGTGVRAKASLLDYLPSSTLVAIDEPTHLSQIPSLPNPQIYLQELQIAPSSQSRIRDDLHTMNLATRPVPIVPHQFAKVASFLREELQLSQNVFLISAQPSRSVSLLQEHDCPAQFVPNPHDYRAIEKLTGQKTPVALKYSGTAELEGLILPQFRLVIVTDREFYGQHVLATPTYLRKRRQAVSKQIDLNKVSPGDYIVHRHHGIGQFIKLENLDNREYLTIKYADGLLRVPADRMGTLSKFRSTTDKKPELHKLSSKAWENTKKKVKKAIKSLAVDLLQLYAKRSEQKGYAHPPDSPWQTELEDSFPYEPTADQLKAIQDVKRDLESDRPMDRLVIGDVGFGKTEVAIRAIFKVVTAGKQVALLAPTTILTQQHYHTIKERFAPYPINIALLNRFRSSSERTQILKKLQTGEIDVVVGTQALLGSSVRFRDLGLLVVDEEQRFGVNQKEKIKSLKTQLDVLTLSATPIPRTLYMAISGVREMSSITTPPPGRRPIQTHLSPYDMEMVRMAIRHELERGGQVFYVVPRIEGIEEVAAKLRELLPSARIAVAHGQMEPAELESIMLGVGAGEVDILLSTTIIESGLDIPRVNTILIEDAHKFGLAQLYQLRGRVGRAGIQAHAWMFYPQGSDGVARLTDAARARLRAIQEFTQLGSGYQLAMRDMEIRGVGNILGAEQSGQMDAIGFDLYVEMLTEAINEIRGQEIPQVDDTQIDLRLTAFIPADYIPDLDQKMSAYRAVAVAETDAELNQIAADWSDRYGPIPTSAQQLLSVVRLKQIAKKLGFARIKSEGQHLILETPMEEPAWKLLSANLPPTLQPKFIYTKGKVTIRGWGVLTPTQQLANLIDTLSKMVIGH
ncbi:transcription-repair coupling factor [[Phormidium] sp. ETS-05]|uniref:transcription-repair coupling factor n=1 Tax=[Phormidium] sp. ETS-05 TaxID=222819 RepID=UPI0018EF2477|nr:transcription-repair coupling factor [[Phormidium] sp. ETS-05]